MLSDSDLTNKKKSKIELKVKSYSCQCNEIDYYKIEIETEHVTHEKKEECF